MGRLRSAALIAVFAATALSALLAAQTADFSAKVRLVRLLATVKDEKGALIGGLNKQDFRVTDNGVPQEVAVFERQTEQPLNISLLIDTSASTAKDIKYETDALRRFLKTLIGEGNPKDTASLYSFNWQTIQLSGFTRRMSRLEDAIARLHSVGGTSLYDAITLAAKDLDGRDGRHVMIVITDGGDTTSSTRYADASRELQMADAILYAILVVPITNDAGRNIGGENALATLTASTGGRVFTPSPGPQLDVAFSDIMRDLRTQYFLGYYPRNIPQLTEKFHKVQTSIVRGESAAGKSGLRVFTRTGYYED